MLRGNRIFCVIRSLIKSDGSLGPTVAGVRVMADGPRWDSTLGAPGLVYSLSLLQNRNLAASKRNRPGRERPGRLPIQVMALGHLS